MILSFSLYLYLFGVCAYPMQCLFYPFVLCCVRWYRKLNDWRTMVTEAITELLEGILLVVVGNGGQLYRALKNLELELL
jgi:hypothetical protein